MGHHLQVIAPVETVDPPLPCEGRRDNGPIAFAELGRVIANLPQRPLAVPVEHRPAGEFGYVEEFALGWLSFGHRNTARPVSMFTQQMDGHLQQAHP